MTEQERDQLLLDLRDGLQQLRRDLKDGHRNLQQRMDNGFDEVTELIKAQALQQTKDRNEARRVGRRVEKLEQRAV